MLIAAMLGVVLTFNVVTEQTRLLTVTFAVTNQTYNLTGTYQNSTVISCPFGTGYEWEILNDANLHLYNSSACSTGEFTRNTDYELLNNATATITLNITGTGRAKTPAFMCLRYNYRSAYYADSPIVRAVLNLLPLLVVVVILSALAMLIIG